jgi:hypothetical protein
VKSPEEVANDVLADYIETTTEYEHDSLAAEEHIAIARAGMIEMGEWAAQLCPRYFPPDIEIHIRAKLDSLRDPGRGGGGE